MLFNKRGFRNVFCWECNSCDSLLKMHDYYIYILYKLANSLTVASASIFRDTKLF